MLSLHPLAAGAGCAAVRRSIKRLLGQGLKRIVTQTTTLQSQRISSTELITECTEVYDLNKNFNLLFAP